MSDKMTIQIQVNGQSIQIPTSGETNITITVHPACGNKQQMREKFQALESTYAKELQVLTERGFAQPRRNLRLLSKFNGDVDQVVSFIEKRSKKDLPSDPEGSTDQGAKQFQSQKEKLKLLQDKYSSELSRLEESGFTKRNMNARLLNRFAGDYDKVLEVLQRQSANEENFKKLKVEYSEQLIFLNENGFQKPRQNVNVLRKCEGNQEKALQRLQQLTRNPGPCHGKGRHNQSTAQPMEC